MNHTPQTMLVTGTAGFIGYHLAKRLLERGDTVIGIDNINDYYEINLKLDRLADTGISKECLEWHKPIVSEVYSKYTFVRINLEDRNELFQLFKNYKVDKVCNLAAQAGVRFSIENPYTYIDSNIVGFINILEACRHYKIQHLVYASSSSVYGNSLKMPLSTNDNVDYPISLYAATKRSNELMSHTYSHLFGIPTTGLRFFTVYGPWGRPDMAYYLFTKAIVEGETIKVFNNGDLSRDFTYINDIIDGVINVIDNQNEKSELYKLYNIGNSEPVKLLEFIRTIEKELGTIAKKEYLPMQPGDVYKTYADVEGLKEDFDYEPNTSISDGLNKFINWYKEYYKYKC